MIKELKYDNCKLGDEIRLPRICTQKEYSGTIANTAEELANCFGIYTDEYFKQLENRSVVFNKFSKDRMSLNKQINDIISTNKNYILITSEYDDYIFWGIKEIDK